MIYTKIVRCDRYDCFLIKEEHIETFPKKSGIFTEQLLAGERVIGYRFSKDK